MTPKLSKTERKFCREAYKDAPGYYELAARCGTVYHYTRAAMAVLIRKCGCARYAQFIIWLYTHEEWKHE